MELAYRFRGKKHELEKLEKAQDQGYIACSYSNKRHCYRAWQWHSDKWQAPAQWQ